MKTLPRLVTPLLMLLAGALVATSGCASYSTHVESDTTALGRVVVYRNGIAYYERTAQVKEAQITLTVPHDKVDDFLKSLTIADAETGKPLPVSYQTSGANSAGTVDMTIQVKEPGVRSVTLTYLTEAPAWKPSYRAVVDEDGIQLQGWAIVDNTSGERWEDVMIGVGSGSALSFKYDLRTVRNIHRERLHTEKQFAVAPPTGGSTRGGKSDEQQVLAALGDSDLSYGALDASAVPMDDLDDMADKLGDSGGLGGLASRNIALTESYTGRGGRSFRPARKPATSAKAKRAADGRRAAAKAAAVSARQRALAKKAAEGQRLDALAQQLQGTKGTITIEGYANLGTSQSGLVANDRANWMRNELINKGVAPARIKVDTKRFAAGQTPGVRVVRSTSPADAVAEAEGQPVGESHFQSKTPLTVDKGMSAMIAVLDDKARGNIVYLYDAESERGNSRYAFKALRFKNPTDSTLETGPITVYGDGRFIGEGLTDPIPPQATAVIPFALDRQVVVERESGSVDKIAKLITLQRGLLRTEVAHTRQRTLKFTSVLHKPTEVFIRHTVRNGWTLTESPEVHERIGESHLFRLVLKPGEVKTVTIAESTPLVKAIDLHSAVGLDLVRLYLKGDDIEARFASPMRKILALHTQMADVRNNIRNTRSRIGEFESRMNKLQTQIISLSSVRGGRNLVRHLQAKLKDMSERVNKGTIDVVNLQETLMLTRIRFQDGISELTLDERQLVKTDVKTDAKTGNDG
ncbi:MAG: hypothetical protein ACI9MR_003070 [Myxococcota bacterium]|jgi:hypothetical protein